MSDDPKIKTTAEEEAPARSAPTGSSSALFSRELDDESRYGSVVLGAFHDESSHAYGDVVLDQVRTEWREADNRARRYMLWAATAGVTFVLLGAGHASELSIAGVKADAQGIDLITKFLPALVLALAAETLVLLRMTSEYQGLYFSLLNRLHPNVLWGQLGYALSPQTMTPWGNDWTVLVGRYKDSAASWWLVGIGLVNAAAMWIAPLGFAVYAYATLLDRYGDSDALLWVSLILGAVNVARYVARTVDRESPLET